MKSLESSLPHPPIHLYVMWVVSGTSGTKVLLLLYKQPPQPLPYAPSPPTPKKVLNQVCKWSPFNWRFFFMLSALFLRKK